MLTKYQLLIDEETYDFSSRHLRNWDQVVCVFCRKDYDGVIRSFSSKFEFVGEAYDLLMDLYLREGINAQPIIRLLTITDRMEYEPQFEAPLDFSTIEWDGMVLSVGSLDNTLASFIKARKSTKYEFTVGKDIVPGLHLQYDRVIMANTVTHELMSNVGTADRDCEIEEGAVGLIDTNNQFKRVPTYIVGDAETYENNPISFQDQKEESGSYFLKIERPDKKLTIDFDFTFTPDPSPNNAKLLIAQIALMRFSEDHPNYDASYIELERVLDYNSSFVKDMNYVGCFPSYDALLKSCPNPEEGSYAVIGSDRIIGHAESVYITPYTNIPDRIEWIPGEIVFSGGRGREVAVSKYRRYIYSIEIEDAPVGTLFALMYKSRMQYEGISPRDVCFGVLKSNITARWNSRAKAVDIDSLTPTAVAQALLDKIAEGKMNVAVNISDYDPRITNTAILPAECIRGISGAKFYSTFKDYSDWMLTVFGYIYTISDPIKSNFVGTERFCGIPVIGEVFEDDLVLAQSNVDEEEIIIPGYDVVEGECPSEYITDAPAFLASIDVFAVYNSSDHKYYTRWSENEDFKGHTAYNTSDGHARRDKVFIREETAHPYYINDEGELVSYNGDPDKCRLDTQTINFVHRSEVFNSNSVREIIGCRDLTYSADDSLVYSSIEVGYEKQNYDAECGRDEWNFLNHYTTGIDVVSTTLSFKSKYRADCYGIEFLAQKRSKDSTDDKSDSAVFFVHCAENETETSTDDETTISSVLKISRSVPISGAISDTVFNGEYSPYRCLMANAEFIAAMATPTILTFASSDGNSDIIIDGVRCDEDITLDNQLFSCGTLKFKSGDVDFPREPNALISVTHHGVTYRGYLTDLTVRYAREESAEYKLIIKDIAVW